MLNETPELGFIGLGNMGRHMAARLLAAQHRLAVYDVNEAATSELIAQGATGTSSPQELASRAAIIFLSLPTPKTLIDVVSGTNGLLEGSAIKVVVDLSTCGPSTAWQMERLLADKGIAYIDCPVSGGVGGAQAGTLTLMASGDRATYSNLEPYLQQFGKSIFYLGEKPGQGQTMKLVNNALSAAAVIASYEGLVFGAKAGLDPTQMLEILNVSSGRSFATEVKIPQCILDRSFPMRFATELVHKDVKLFVDEAEKLGVPMWVIPTAMNLFSLAVAQGQGKEDYGHVIKIYENWAGAEFGSSALQTKSTQEA